jgi:hypothetical protein
MQRMTPGRSRRAPARMHLLLRAAGLIALLVVVACGPAASSPAPTDGPSPIGSVQPSTASAADSSTAIQAGQTDTDWGRIWDALPQDFPVYPGAVRSDEIATDPASATFALDGPQPGAVAAWMQRELERASFSTEGLNGPLEDGSFVLDSTGADGCRIQVAVAPLGSVTTITVRYGAACPNP